MARLSPFERDIEVLIDEDLSPEAQSRTLAAFARETLAEAEAINAEALGHPSPHLTFVDGVEGVSEDRVRPDGTIAYEFSLAVDMFAWIGEQLVKHSPVKTGRFARSFLFLADGQPADAVNPPLAEEYVFVNTQPYARKIEGDDNRAPQSPQAPDGVFEVVAVMANRRFGNLARVRFAFRSLTTGAVAEWARSGSTQALAHRVRGASQRGRHDWLTRQPAIIVRLR